MKFLHSSKQRLNRRVQMARRGPVVDVPSWEPKIDFDRTVLEVELEAQAQTLREMRNESESMLERYTDLFEYAPVGYVSLSSRGIIEELNVAAAQLLDVERDIALGKPFTPFVDARSIQPFLNHLYACGNAASKKTVEIFLRSSTKPVPVRLETRLRRMANEKRFAYRIVMIDISAQQEAEEERARLAQARLERSEADAANRAKSAFLATVSHEMRTPLTSILGFGQVLLSNCTVPEQARQLSTIVRNSQALLCIMNDILDLAKIEADKFEANLGEFEVAAFLRDVQNTALGLTSKKGLELRVRTEGPVPVGITSDAERLRQVFMNVVGNAMKFTDVGLVEIVVHSEAAISEDGGKSFRKLCFTVRDTGIGISAEQRPRLFQPFMQGDRLVSRSHGGTGLGLVLARKLARALGGDLVLKSSEPGQGTTFEFWIEAHAPRWQAKPAELEGSEDKSNSATARRLRAHARTMPLPLKGTRVLVVEDSRDIRDLIQIVLTREGADVSLAADGEEGYEMARSGEFDVVLMDLEMPKLDGHATAHKLRDEGYKKPIVALTARAMKGEKERAQRSGFDGFVTKPVDRVELTAVLLSFHPYGGTPVH